METRAKAVARFAAVYWQTRKQQTIIKVSFFWIESQIQNRLTFVGYRIGYNNSTQLTKSTFKNAYEARRPDDGLIFHTDNGTNYRSKRFVMYLKSLNVTQSFSRAYVPYDNSVMESFFSNLKREELYRKKYCSEKEFRTAVDSYIKFYNLERPHAANKYKTPAQKKAEYYSKQAKNSDV